MTQVRKKLNLLYNTRDIENIENILGKPLGKRIKDMIHNADKMDKELDIVHQCLTELYNYPDYKVGDIVKKYLDKIE